MNPVHHEEEVKFGHFYPLNYNKFALQNALERIRRKKIEKIIEGGRSKNYIYSDKKVILIYITTSQKPSTLTRLQIGKFQLEYVLDN